MVSIDPVTLEVARNRLAAIATEMGVVLRRTAYSPDSGWMIAVSSGMNSANSGRTRISVTRPPPDGRRISRDES